MRAPGSAPNVPTKSPLTTMAEMTTKTASTAEATTTVIVSTVEKKMDWQVAPSVALLRGS